MGLGFAAGEERERERGRERERERKRESIHSKTSSLDEHPCARTNRFDAGILFTNSTVGRYLAICCKADVKSNSRYLTRSL